MRHMTITSSRVSSTSSTIMLSVQGSRAMFSVLSTLPLFLLLLLLLLLNGTPTSATPVAVAVAEAAPSPQIDWDGAKSWFTETFKMGQDASEPAPPTESYYVGNACVLQSKRDKCSRTCAAQHNIPMEVSSFTHPLTLGSWRARPLFQQ